tara:strand:- start:479 stop:1600 length:1122 start_codon:yes stop_codon:yes gene_type:complete
MMKPPYKPLMMSEVRKATGTNGLSVVSTFSGCGGSSIGFRLAGYRILMANEFFEAARNCYKANSDTPVDGRDIRDIKGSEILTAIGLKAGELDVLEGSPPCQSFSFSSNSGNPQKSWGRVVNHSDRTTSRSDDLFWEFVRLLKEMQPRAFSAENISSLAKGVSRGMFKLILATLKESGYCVKARILDAQWLEVPQRRNRIFFVGFRKDLGIEPEFPKPLSYRYVIEDIIKDIDTSEKKWIPEESSWYIGLAKEDWHNLSQGQEHPINFNFERSDIRKPSPTICAMCWSPSGKQGIAHPLEPRKFSIAELKRICSFPDDFILYGKFTEQWARLGNSVPPLMAMAVGQKIRDSLQGYGQAQSVAPTLRDLHPLPQ